MKYLLSFLLVFSPITFAKCPNDIQEIKQGQTANCDGLLFSPEASKKVDEAVHDSKYYKELSDRLYQRQELTNKEINILDQRIKLYMDQSQLLSKELTYKQNEDKWQKIVYFGMGVLATGIAAYAASKLDN